MQLGIGFHLRELTQREFFIRVSQDAYAAFCGDTQKDRRTKNVTILPASLGSKRRVSVSLLPV